MFDTILSVIFPATHLKFCFLLGFVNGSGDFDAELVITDPNQKTIATTRGAFQMRGDDSLANVIFVMEHFPLPDEGRYTVSLYLDGDFITDYHFFARSPATQPRSNDDLNRLLADPNIVKSATAQVSCGQCGAVYRFQHHLDPRQSLDEGHMALPAADSFRCGTCNNDIPLLLVKKNLQTLVVLPKGALNMPPPNQQI